MCVEASKEMGRNIKWEEVSFSSSNNLKLNLNIGMTHKQSGGVEKRERERRKDKEREIKSFDLSRWIPCAVGLSLG